jgi:hypothetical protein
MANKVAANLANQPRSWMKDDWYAHFSSQIQVIPEEWIPAATIATSDFMRLGLTDAALAAMAASDVIPASISR